jgi:hypothetical protein
MDILPEPMGTYPGLMKSPIQKIVILDIQNLSVKLMPLSWAGIPLKGFGI